MLRKQIAASVWAIVLAVWLTVTCWAQPPTKSAGIQLFEKGDLAGAIAALKDSDDVVDLHFLATAHERLGHEKEARKAFDRSFRRGYEEFSMDLIARARFGNVQPAPVEKLSPFLEKYADRVIVTGLSAKRSLDLKGDSSKDNEWLMRAIFFAELARILAANEMVYSKRELDVELRISSKPRPGYTDQARTSNEQGTVELIVLYGADAKIRAAWPIRPLRHGLTEQAYNATLKQKFTPAEKNGKPVAVLGVTSYSFSIY